ncbi:unnamed protein product [Schistosoma mattheei]|uniref:Uncharacterized protein n=1 Tax=Schistosoma mattheei TaxID=31246 RepID=A0A183PXJ3_9TREM|nr:unnamed protein product [Schistosoma mattheei]
MLSFIAFCSGKRSQVSFDHELLFRRFSDSLCCCCCFWSSDRDCDKVLFCLHVSDNKSLCLSRSLNLLKIM